MRTIIVILFIAVSSRCLAQRNFVYEDKTSECYAIGKIKDTYEGKDFWVEIKAKKGQLTAFRKQQIESLVQYHKSTRGYAAYTYTKMHFLVRCGSDKMTMLACVDYSANGSVIRDNNVNSEEDIVPGSVGEDIYNYPCTLNKKLTEISQDGELIFNPRK